MMTAYDDQDALHEATTGVPNIFALPVFGDVLVPALWDDVSAALRERPPLMSSGQPTRPRMMPRSKRCYISAV